jgi:putative transposase
MSRAARMSMIDLKHPELPIVKQCVLLNVCRSTVYYRPAPESDENLMVMRLIDEQYLRTPCYGARKFVEWLLRQGHVVNRKRVSRLMRLMGIEAIYQKPNTSKKHPGNKIYPYLLRAMTIDRVNQVWCTDITYIRMPKGFLYLVVVMDWVSRKALSWRLSNTMDADFCVEALEEALARYGRPEIFNTDQGSQFTSADFTGVLLREGIAISMDGKGRFMDNIFIERLWRSLKYEEVFIKSYATAFEARSGIGNYIELYNTERIHQTLNYRTPDEVFRAGTGLWICGQSATPTGSASPMFPPTTVNAASSVHGNMGKCSPLPTYPQAQPQQEELDLTIGKKMVIFPAAPPASRMIGAQAPGGTLS